MSDHVNELYIRNVSKENHFPIQEQMQIQNNPNPPLAYTWIHVQIHRTSRE